MYVIVVYADGHYRLSLASDGCRCEHMMSLDWRHDSDRPFDDSTIRTNCPRYHWWCRPIRIYDSNSDMTIGVGQLHWAARRSNYTKRSSCVILLVVWCNVFNALSWRIVNKLPNACHVMSSGEKWSWLLSDIHLNSRYTDKGKVQAWLVLISIL